MPRVEVGLALEVNAGLTICQQSESMSTQHDRGGLEIAELRNGHDMIDTDSRRFSIFAAFLGGASGGEKQQRAQLTSVSWMHNIRLVWN